MTGFPQRSKPAPSIPFPTRKPLPPVLWDVWMTLREPGEDLIAEGFFYQQEAADMEHARNLAILAHPLYDVSHIKVPEPDYVEPIKVRNRILFD